MLFMLLLLRFTMFVRLNSRVCILQRVARMLSDILGYVVSGVLHVPTLPLQGRAQGQCAFPVKQHDYGGGMLIDNAVTRSGDVLSRVTSCQPSNG